MDNFYAVPLMGGILCVISLFTPTSLGFVSLNNMILLILFISVILEEICGIILIVFAVKLKKGKTPWIKQEKILLVFSLLALITPFVPSIIISIDLEYLRIFLFYGMAGGFITLIGVIFRHRITDSDSYYDTIIKERTDDKSLKVNQSPTAGPKFCRNCGTDLKGGTFKFCPECGTELS